MAWQIQDFVTGPSRFRLKLQTQVNGFSRATFQTVYLGDDRYQLDDFGRNSEGTVAGSEPIPGQYRVTGNKGSAGNAYLLPWYDDSVCRCELGGEHDLFFTPTVNSCAILISGGRCNPFVAHANAKSTDRIEVGPPSTMIPQFQEVYGELGQLLARKGMMDPANLVVFQPGDYQSFGAVFGVRQSGRWVFYGNTWLPKGSVTRQIWPRA